MQSPVRRNWRSYKNKEREPDLTSPTDIHAIFVNEFGACGCSNMAAMINVVRDVLEWIGSDMDTRPSYDTLFERDGTYYIIVGTIDVLGLSEHGVSIRNPWLTEWGETFLLALQTIDGASIADCPHGEAYDGIYY